MRDPDDIYWRPFFSCSVGRFIPVCMQWFDEWDYDQSRFLNQIHYETERLCQEVCAEWAQQVARLKKALEAE